MNCVNIIFIICIGVVLFVNSKKNDKEFLPNLPLGEYRLNYKAIVRCNLNSHSAIEQNYYFNKISSNVTSLRGNFTLKKPFDDSFTAHFNFAIKDSIGGWKDNAHVFKIPKACSSMKHYWGPLWIQFCSSLGLKSADCPIQPGVYELNNTILHSSLSDTIFPKSFFYGTYKVRSYFTDDSKNQHGCVSYVIEVKRPWEMD